MDRGAWQPMVYRISDLDMTEVTQEAGQVVWDSHLLKNFPQFIAIHTVKGFAIINKAKVDVFLELSFFFHNPADVGLQWHHSDQFSRSVVSNSL